MSLCQAVRLTSLNIKLGPGPTYSSPSIYNFINKIKSKTLVQVGVIPTDLIDFLAP